MMKRTMGSFGLYWDGLAPSMTPPCDGARSPVGVASAEAEVSVERTELAVVDMVAAGNGGFVTLGPDGTKRVVREEARGVPGRKGRAERL